MLIHSFESPGPCQDPPLISLEVESLAGKPGEGLGQLPLEPGPEEGWCLCKVGQTPIPTGTPPHGQGPEGQDLANSRLGEVRMGTGVSRAQ